MSVVTCLRDARRVRFYVNSLYHSGRESFLFATIQLLCFEPCRPISLEKIDLTTRAEAQKGHASYPLEGRTPLILACLLIERGYSVKKVLTKVNTFWSKTLPFLVCSPLSEAQQMFVLEW